MKTNIAWVLTGVLLLGLLCGCGAEKARVDISDGGDLSGSGAATSGSTSGTGTTVVVTAPPHASAEPEYVTLRYGDETASVTVESVSIGDDGKLTVTLAGTGYGFNGVLPMRNGSMVIPFSADVTVNGETRSWSSASVSGGTVTFVYDVSALPQEVVVYSADRADETYTFDAVSFRVTEAAEPAAEDPDALPEGWYRTVEHSPEDFEVDWVETTIYDEQGRMRDFSDVKRSKEGDEYEFSVAFHHTYTYTDGSPIVEFTAEFFEYDWETGELTGYGKEGLTYTMESPDNHVELWSGWSETGVLDENGIMGQACSEFNGMEYGPDGTELGELSLKIQ